MALPVARTSRHKVADTHALLSRTQNIAVAMHCKLTVANCERYEYELCMMSLPPKIFLLLHPDSPLAFVHCGIISLNVPFCSSCLFCWLSLRHAQHDAATVALFVTIYWFVAWVILFARPQIAYVSLFGSYFSPDPILHFIRPLSKSTVRPTPRIYQIYIVTPIWKFFHQKFLCLFYAWWQICSG